jgi:hypothetical protein
MALSPPPVLVLDVSCSVTVGRKTNEGSAHESELGGNDPRHRCTSIGFS